MTIPYVLYTRDGEELFWAAGDEAARKLAEGAARTTGWAKVVSALGRTICFIERED